MLTVFLIIDKATKVPLVEQHLLVRLIHLLSRKLLRIFSVSFRRLSPADALIEIQGHLGPMSGLEVVIELLLIAIDQSSPLKVTAGKHLAHVDCLRLIAA